MIEQVLSRHNAALRVKITVKTLISLGIIALAVILPQLVHLVLLAQVAGRLTFLVTAAIFQSVSPLSAATVWSQIQTGLWGLVLQAVLVPFLVMGLRLLLVGNKD